MLSSQFQSQLKPPIKIFRERGGNGGEAAVQEATVWELQSHQPSSDQGLRVVAGGYSAGGYSV